uniref:uncharacterized protein LOC131110094 isoform X2 n=1 Tax=Doryrhamphus excisus TaxID=161450 RepID=UPI0025AE2323|nr:uncharacterized protein LOC131110094 isoform X2 [Doryrhamphus excisus]
MSRTRRGSGHRKSRMMRLQERWQELKGRECAARRHNKELLQQFDRTQDMLREMMSATAAMKTTRLEYGQYLEDAPYWQKQLQEKTEVQHRTTQAKHPFTPSSHCPTSPPSTPTFVQPSHPQRWPPHSPPSWASNQADLHAHLYVKAGTSGSWSRESSPSSQELDVQPVRLSSEQESAGSSRLRQANHEKKKGSASLDRDSSQETSRRSAAPAAHMSDGASSSPKGSTVRRTGRNVGGSQAGPPKSKNDALREVTCERESSRDLESMGGSKRDVEELSKEESREEEEGEETSAEDVDEEEGCEESDSDDIIISPLQTKLDKHVVPEEAAHEEKASRRAATSDEDSSELFHEDIEHLLAPQHASKKRQESDRSAEEEPEGTTTRRHVSGHQDVASCNVDTSPVTTHQQSGSEDFDQFYD